MLIRHSGKKRGNYSTTEATYDNNISEMIVDEFYDLITKAEQPVKHAAIRPQGRTHEWQWQLAGTYTIANSRQTVAMATNRSQRRGAAMDCA